MKIKRVIVRVEIEGENPGERIGAQRAFTGEALFGRIVPAEQHVMEEASSLFNQAVAKSREPKPDDSGAVFDREEAFSTK